MLPRDTTVLDVGCGDGLLDRMLMNARPDLRIEGIDVLLRPQTHIPVTLFDGRRIPHPDKSFDAVTFVDVLHHTDDPAVLLAEAGRVARRCVVIKDHTNDTALSGPILRFMDWLGNERHGVRLPYNYWSSAQWSRAFAGLGWKLREDRRDLGLYPAPADLVFGRGLHCLVRLDVADAARG
jgi:ubiquinone/menaquinone biosynthesis C-methylase UbiE